MKKTKSPARNAESKKPDMISLRFEKNSYDRYDDDYWHNQAGGKKREKKRKPKVTISGKSVFTLKEILKKSPSSPSVSQK